MINAVIMMVLFILFLTISAMIKQFRLDRFNGVEVLVCEFYNRHTWTKDENDAYNLFLEDHLDAPDSYLPYDFRYLLDEWLDKEHEPGSTFYGLTEPIPVIESIPCIVVRGAVVNNRIVSISSEFSSSVTPLEVMDAIGKLFEFVRSPHWRNTILRSVSDHGTLFGSDNNS